MTQLDDAALPPQAIRLRTELDVVGHQLAGIAEFNRARELRRGARSGDASLTREQRMDLDRQEEVRQREHDALVARLQAQLEGDIRPILSASPRRLVIAHRNAWFVGKVSAAMEEHALEVVARLDNGADAVGTIIAEQPDLVLVEDALEMVPGLQVVRDVRQFCPETVIAAQVAHADRADALVEAGAAAVFTRSIPPADVAAGLLQLLDLQTS